MGCGPSKKDNIYIPALQRELSINTLAVFKDFKENSHQYVYKDFLGHGRFGRVLLGESPETHHQVAIKVLPKQDLPVEKLMSEVDILSAVDHPNIVKYMKHYESKRYLYIVMEYCPGGDLFQKVIKQNKFNEAEAAIVMEEVLRAINHCHHLGIIHRDLKPENIMYSSDGTLKIIDFGLSIKENTEPSEQLVGTAYYMAPEIVREEKFTKAGDIWSLGVLLHILLTGFVPLGGRTFEEIKEEIRAYSGLVFEFERWQGVSSEAKDLVRKMLESDYERRITAAEALKHPWFTSNKSLKTNFNEKSIEALRNYSQFSKLKKDILTVLVKNISDTELKEFQEAFLQLDKNKTGMITCKDLEENLNKIGSKATAKELEELTRRINYKGEAFINYSTFMAALVATRQFMTEEKIDSFYKVLEVEGRAENVEARQKIGATKICPDDPTARSVINSEEKLTFGEFKELLMELK
uniref:Protein kinase n=1 Tax=Nyctotherus ovalis TaxID=70075 RepID=Q8WQ18_NYCOV|nr:protein kinase [Nyctotherus ovalis]